MVEFEFDGEDDADISLIPGKHDTIKEKERRELEYDIEYG